MSHLSTKRKRKFTLHSTRSLKYSFVTLSYRRFPWSSHPTRLGLPGEAVNLREKR